jgi:hypothetical protein
MPTHASANFAIKSWDEKTWEGKPASEVTGAKLTRAEVTYSYQGEIEGEATLQYLMSYNEDGTGTYVGLERVVGRIGERSGSFTLQHIGTFDPSSVTATLSVVRGSASDELHGLRGKAEVVLAGGHQESWPITLNYDFE